MPETRTTRSPASEAPEHWAADAGDGAVASLQVPPHASRERRFEISCSMTVRRVDAAVHAWHQLRVLADGQRQWQRRIETHPGVDGLDYRFERRVPAGQALRLVAEAGCAGAIRRSLSIEADEVRD